jgi:glutathione S-transferase
MAPAALRSIHPLGKSPTITDSDRVVAESGAIIDYIVRRHGGGRLHPDLSEAAYDDYVYWLHYAEGSAVASFVIKPIAESFGKMAGSAAPTRRLRDGSESFLDRTLADRVYPLGDQLTAADIQMSCGRFRGGERQHRPVSELRRPGETLSGPRRISGHSVAHSTCKLLGTYEPLHPWATDYSRFASFPDGGSCAR